MTGELGQLALCLALALSLVQAFSGFAGAARGNARVMAMGRGAALGSFVFIALAFFTLMFAYVTSDFSVMAVAENSHTAKPLIYKITGVWGNHEGSMMLWLLILGIYSAAIAMTQPDGQRRRTRELGSRALGVQALIAIAFLIFVLLTSDPFLRLYPPPFEGNGLNPLLQDPGSRLPSAAALSRLCRTVGGVFLRRGGAARQAQRCGLGARGRGPSRSPPGRR